MMELIIPITEALVHVILTAHIRFHPGVQLLGVTTPTQEVPVIVRDILEPVQSNARALPIMFSNNIPDLMCRVPARFPIALLLE